MDKYSKIWIVENESHIEQYIKQQIDSNISCSRLDVESSTNLTSSTTTASDITLFQLLNIVYKFVIIVIQTTYMTNFPRCVPIRFNQIFPKCFNFCYGHTTIK